MEKLFKVKEAAKLLRISRATLYRLMKQGVVRAIKIGGTVLFKESDLNDLIERSAHAPGALDLAVAEPQATYGAEPPKKPGKKKRQAQSPKSKSK